MQRTLHNIATTMKRIRILVIEDSELIQHLLLDVIKSDPELELIAIAASGEEGLALAKTQNPDIISLDVVLPDMDGLEVVERVTKHAPIPIMMLSTLTEPDHFVAVKAMQIGAMDCMAKPKDMHANMNQFRKEYLEKVKEVAAIPRERIQQVVRSVSAKPRLTIANTLIVIGSTIGGYASLSDVLSAFPGDLRACVLVLQHLSSSFTKALVSDLATCCKMRIKEAEVGDVFVEGLILVAPGNQTIKIVRTQDGWSRISIATEAPLRRQMRPWIDKAMDTAADCFGTQCIGVLLSGLGTDGVRGIKKIRDIGGKTFAQNDFGGDTSEIVRSAKEANALDEILPTQEMMAKIVRHVNSFPSTPKTPPPSLIK